MLKDNLARIMEEGGLTPEALAARMQSQGHAITGAAVRAWMSGYRTPNFINAQGIAKALGCTIDALLAEPEKAAV